MSIEQRMELLIKTMGISAISYSKGYPKIEDRYNAIVGTYLSGFPQLIPIPHFHIRQF